MPDPRRYRDRSWYRRVTLAMLVAAFLTITITAERRRPGPDDQIPLTRNEISRLLTATVIRPAAVLTAAGLSLAWLGTARATDIPTAGQWAEIFNPYLHAKGSTLCFDDTNGSTSDGTQARRIRAPGAGSNGPGSASPGARWTNHLQTPQVKTSIHDFAVSLH